MRFPIDVRDLTFIAGSNPAGVMGMVDGRQWADRATNSPLWQTDDATNARGRFGRAYRAGQLVCGCVRVTARLDDRLGLAPREQHLVRVQFHEPLADDLRTELTLLVRRRGTAARRIADGLEVIEIVLDDPYGEHQRIVGGLQPPDQRHGQLGDIAFVLRQPERPR